MVEEKTPQPAPQTNGHAKAGKFNAQDGLILTIKGHVCIKRKWSPTLFSSTLKSMLSCPLKNNSLIFFKWLKLMVKSFIVLREGLCKGTN